MNEKRFIALVNLYIDHEISPGELEELENEVAHNAQRRQVYHEYCRLQNASRTACQEFRSSLVQTVDLKKYQILSRGAGSRFRLGFLYSAGALTAACLSVLAATSVFQDQALSAGESGPARADAASVAVVEVFDPDALDARVARASARTFLSNLPINPREFTSYRVSRGSDLFEAVRSSARTGFQLTAPPATSWADDFRSASAGRVFRSNSSFEAPDVVSVQFQR